MAQRTVKHAKLTNRQIGKLIELFAYEVPASKAARILGVNRNTATRIYRHIRERIAAFCETEAPFEIGEHEADESYFGGHRKGRRGRGAAGKVIVFGLLKRNGRVYTRPVPNVSRATLRLVIKSKVPDGSTIYTDSLASYDGLITDGYKHYRINHQHEFARGTRNHINGIENFWGFAKTKLRRYYGLSRKTFPLFLKECEFRFNYRNADLVLKIKEILKK